MSKVKVIVLRTAGTNCDMETAQAFSLAGATAETIHINSLASGEKKLSDYQILAIPGGFTYGDDIASGKILANELKHILKEELKTFIQNGKLVIGICNGFQVLVKSGFLPNFSGDTSQETTLALNDSGRFMDCWVSLKSLKSKCIWTKNLPATIALPVAHGEGKFVASKGILKKIKDSKLIAFQYTRGDNPNGSIDNIAGICDTTGQILGLMPHPERHMFASQSPFWTKQKDKKDGDGLAIFKNGVDYVKKYL